jgi:nucleoside-diphosphate-sugar epimerase
VRGRNSDNTQLEIALGWQPSVSLQDGMAQTYAWIYDQLAERVVA